MSIHVDSFCVYLQLLSLLAEVSACIVPSDSMRLGTVGIFLIVT